jgi:hypothetical protein
MYLLLNNSPALSKVLTHYKALGAETKCSFSEIMHRLQGMSYNPTTSKTTVLYRLRGCATYLGPHRRSAPSSPMAFYGKPGSRSDARWLRIRPSSGTS